MAKVFYEVLQGKISNLSSGSELVSTNNTLGTKNTWAFRINNTPVSFKTPVNLSFSEGDIITSVGVNRNGTFHIACLRNETTGSVYEPPTVKLAYFVGILLILIGLPFLFLFLFGVIPIALGIYYIRVAQKTKEAIVILQRTPAPHPIFNH